MGWEERDEVVSFPLVKVEPETLWFDGLTMRQVADDSQRVRAALKRPGEGVRKALFTYRRVDPEGTPGG